MLLGWGKHTIRVLSSRRNGSYLLLLTSVLEALLCLPFLPLAFCLDKTWPWSPYCPYSQTGDVWLTGGKLSFCAWRGSRMSNRWPFIWVIPQTSKSEKVLLNVFPNEKNNGNGCIWGQIWEGRQQPHEGNAFPLGETGPRREDMGPNWVESSPAGRELGTWQANWTRASNGLCQKGAQQAGLWVRPTASRPGMGSIPSVLLSWGCVWAALSILGLPDTRKTWNKSSGCYKSVWGLRISHTGGCWRSWVCLALGRC